MLLLCWQRKMCIRFAPISAWKLFHFPKSTPLPIYTPHNVPEDAPRLS